MSLKFRYNIFCNDVEKTPEGGYCIGMTFSQLSGPASAIVKRSPFMVRKLPPTFTLASELLKPDSIYCFGATHKKLHGAIAITPQKPLLF